MGTQKRNGPTRHPLQAFHAFHALKPSGPQAPFERSFP